MNALLDFSVSPTGSLVIVGIGFAWVITALRWESIINWWYEGKPPIKPKTLDQRLGELEQRISGVDTAAKQQFAQGVDLLTEISNKHNDLHSLSSERIGALEYDRTKAIGERSDLSIRISAVERKSSEAETRLEEHRPWISDLQRSLGATQQELPVALLFTAEISTLISEADMIMAYLEGIKRHEPESDPGKLPFSKDWMEMGDATVPFHVIEWARLVKWHVRKCVDLASRFSILQSIVISDDLQLCAVNWNQPTSMQESQQMVWNHRARLYNARDSYAAKLTGRIAARATTS